MEQRYCPRNVLVTGGAGFIGSHMVIYLVKKYPNYHIYNLDKMDYCASLTYLKEIEGKDNYSFIKGDILSVDLINHILTTYKIDTILHFAAQSHVDNSFGNSLEFTKNNILGTHTLLECSKGSPYLKRFVHVSTDEVYGETAYDDNTQEEALLMPTNPYAASKAGAEHLVRSYHKSFNFPVILTRSNNVYGPHQFPEKVIPKFLCLMERGLPCTLHGSGESKRSFIYVDDVVRAYDIILHDGVEGDVYNICANHEISMKELASQIIAFYERNEDDCVTHVEDRAFNDLRYHIDGSKMKKLGFEPEYTFEKGLKKTMEWYKSTDLSEIWPSWIMALEPHPTLSMWKNVYKN